ncbi:MAG: NAD(P)H nitroreductase [Lachnospiraceae bacterium]|nr:NAD(P)H nitroreductase [Lachnospiraceae bacterium]
MNEVMQAILSRRSTRAFTDRHIEMEELKQIIEAAVYAPSAKNQQSWHFTVVRSREKIGRLAAVIGEALKRDGYDMYCPDTIILVAAERGNPHGQLDTGCVMENIFLAAHSLGIGSVWINQLKDICDVPKVRAVLDELGLPAGQLVWGTAALGYIAKETPVKPRREGVVNIVE